MWRPLSVTRSLSVSKPLVGLLCNLLWGFFYKELPPKKELHTHQGSDGHTYLRVSLNFSQWIPYLLTDMSAMQYARYSLNSVGRILLY